MKETILITGANRGLGLEFTRQLSQNYHIIACCREPQQAIELQKLQHSNSNISIVQLDITSADDIQRLQHSIHSPIDILINNAGILESDGKLGTLSVEHLTQTFLVNAVGPLKLTEALQSSLAQGNRKLVVCLSSRVGSISDNTSGGYYSYRAGKVALNMLMKTAAFDLAHYQIKVLLLHPGWVKTRMGGSGAPLSPETSVVGMIKVIENYSPQVPEVHFYNYEGKVIPW